ncbi:unnamed protein product [Leuciscus chuanchicus]
MSGNGNPCPSPLGGFPMPHYPYFFPHMLGGLSPPSLPGLPVSGYSTPSPATFQSSLPRERVVMWFSDLWRRPLCILVMTVHNVLTRWVGAHFESATDAVAAANHRRQGGFGSQSAAAPSWAWSY